MRLPGRISLAGVLLLLAVVLSSSLPAAAAAARRAQPQVAASTATAAGPATTGRARRTGKDPANAAARRDAFVPGRVLVRFRAAAGERGRRTAAAAVDGRVVAGTGRTRMVKLDRGADVRAAARRLARQPEVALAEPDWIRRVDACNPKRCWHLQPRPGANVVAAHAGGASGDGRTVAVVDTGVAAGVADLEGRVTDRRRCTGHGCVATEDPPACTHGTEVASVVAANDDDRGTIGVAPDATVVSYRVDDPDDPGCGIPISFLGAALRGIAADDEVDVVNMSLGGSQWSGFEEAAVEAVLDAGKVVVASAGNNGDRMPQYPAAFPGVISVGATDDQGQIAEFSSYGKVDVVAPGVCVAVAEVADTQQQLCGGRQSGPGAAFASGTSFAAPIVSGLLALAESRSPLLARLALEASADGDHPDGEADAKQWAHGLADADAFVDAHRSGAPPALVLETSSQRLGSGDGQLPHPDTTYVAYAFQAAQLLAANPGAASFAVAGPGTPDIEAVPFEAVPGEPGTFRAVLATGPLDPGLREEIASATIEGEATTDSVPALVLEPDDQAPGVPLVGSGDDAWRRVDSVDRLDLDDVYAVTLDAGDRLDVAFASRSSVPVAALLLKPGTLDVYGQLQEQVVACGGGAGAGCPRGLHYQARSSGTYLLDVFSDPTGPAADYRLTWTVRAADGPPVRASVPACSPNGDGVKDRCAWTAGAVSGWTTTSFVTTGSSLVKRQAGAGAHTWDGRDQDGIERGPGRYRLRVLSTQADGRAQLRAVVLTLDQNPPSIATATASPNPFEPRPHDGDRDTTTFAMTSSEPGRLRVIIYRYASTTVVRVLVSGSQAAGRQVVGWSGRRSSGAWLRGRYSYVAEAVDAAGNASRSRRHYVKVLSAGRK